MKDFPTMPPLTDRMMKTVTPASAATAFRPKIINNDLECVKTMIPVMHKRLKSVNNQRITTRARINENLLRKK